MSKIEWNQNQIVIGGTPIGHIYRVVEDEDSAFDPPRYGFSPYSVYPAGHRHESFEDMAAARRAVESAFEAWLDRTGLQWKDSPTEEKEA